MKTIVCRNHSFQVNRKKNATGIRLLTSSNQAAIFVSTSCEERHNKLFLAINLAGQQKTTKIYFSSRVRKQFKRFHFSKPSRCCLRSDKLRCVNFRFWSRLGCSGKNAIMFSRKDLFYGCTRRNIKNYIYFQFVLFTLFM